ncbi:phosphate acyltransferase [Enterococcus avium]|uniref:phosphate acyltransferase n=1 Tax=Enterococcus avium TaxID=33945 RepID=UPI0015E76776|nr:phosphate acyltransferase [Enterococcus avium]
MKNFAELKKRFRNSRELKTIVVVNAVDQVSIQAAIMAKNQDLAKSILVGDTVKIRELLLENRNDAEDFEIISAETPEIAAEISINLIREGHGEALLKGHIQTGTLLKAVVNNENGIKEGPLLSHVTLLQIPGYQKLLGFTDGAMVLFPDFSQKKLLLENAVTLFHKLGYEKPKVGIIEANELIHPKITTSLEAEQLMQLQRSGEITGCVIQGPISFDLATDPAAVEAKQYTGAVKGDADILLAPNITVANVMVKALQTFGRAKTAGIVLGAKCPIILVSRASSAEEKVTSMMLALAAAKGE